MCSKEVTELIWGGNPNFSIYVQKEAIFLRGKNPTELLCFEMLALKLVPKKLF